MESGTVAPVKLNTKNTKYVIEFKKEIRKRKIQTCNKFGITISTADGVVWIILVWEYLLLFISLTDLWLEKKKKNEIEFLNY